MCLQTPLIVIGTHWKADLCRLLFSLSLISHRWLHYISCSVFRRTEESILNFQQSSNGNIRLMIIECGHWDFKNCDWHQTIIIIIINTNNENFRVKAGWRWMAHCTKTSCNPSFFDLQVLMYQGLCNSNFPVYISTFVFSGPGPVINWNSIKIYKEAQNSKI